LLADCFYLSTTPNWWTFEMRGPVIFKSHFDLTNCCFVTIFSNKGGFNDVNTFYHVKYRYLQANNHRVRYRSAKIKEFLVQK
jgi:hypothetical protein